MGLLGDFFSFFGSVLMGKKDSSREFLESLSMGERYLRWGVERRDLRDYQAALDQFLLCDDRDVPKHDILLRKYNGLTNTVSGMVNLKIEKFKSACEDVMESASSVIEERSNTEQAITKSKKRIDTLKSEGSLIKVKDEERTLHDLEVKLQHLSKMAEEDDSASQKMNLYLAMTDDSEQLLSNFESSVLALEVNPELPPNFVGGIRDQALSKIESLKAELEKCNPDESSTSDAAGDEDSGE